VSRGEEVRGLSDTEAAFAYTHGLLRGSGRLTTTFTVHGVFSPERVERAVERWLARLPVLSLRIAAADGRLWFRQGAPSAAHSVLAAAEADDGPAGERLWRLRAEPGPAGATRFRLTLHPAICDGYSVGRLVRPLLDALFDTPGLDAADRSPEALPPDTDELTYEGGGGCVCGVCVPGAPRRARAVAPYQDDRHPRSGEGGESGERGLGEGRTAGAVTLALTPYESRRLRDWCGAGQVTVSGFLTTVLADALARETGRTEVTVATAMSLRRRYTERALIAEPGCVLGMVRARLGAGAAGDPLGRARENAAALCLAGRAWRPERRAHAGIRSAVEREAGARGPELRVVDAGSVDTALGPHAARVTGFRTVAARGAGRPGGSLYLSSFKGALTASLTSQGLGERWAARAERELSEAARLRPAFQPL
jgi:hypothetical protein